MAKKKSSTDQKRGVLGIRAQLFIVFTLIFSVAIAGFGLALANGMGDVARASREQSLRDNVSAVSATNASQLQSSDIIAVAASEDKDDLDPAFDFIAPILETAASKREGIGRIYTVIESPENPGELLFVTVYSYDANGTPTLETDLFLQPYVPIGSPDNGDSNLEWIFKAFPSGNTSGEVVASETTYSDATGTIWGLGFAPTEGGEALVGVELTTNAFSELNDLILVTAAYSLAAVVPLLIISIFIISGAIVRPIKAISGAARILEEEGSIFEPESLDKVSKRGDELGQLSRVFTRMAIEVQAREARLKAQVEELKIEIDIAKQQRQVEEITETDFFQNLQSQAKEVRRRSTKHENKEKED